jgi:hypothetical protein
MKWILLLLLKDQGNTEYVAYDGAPNRDTILKDSNITAEPIMNQKSLKDHKTVISHEKVQDQLKDVELLWRNLFIIS